MQAPREQPRPVSEEVVVSGLSTSALVPKEWTDEAPAQLPDRWATGALAWGERRGDPLPLIIDDPMACNAVPPSPLIGVCKAQMGAE